MSRNKTIMIVDDNQDILNIVKAVLEGHGCEVISATNGMDFLSRLEHQKPDLIILDIMLPDIDGLEILKRLKDNVDTASIPVIMLTILEQCEDIDRAYELGCTYYLTKPFTSRQLLNAIGPVLENQ
ncbi:MAG: response regulator [Deltaproteobacteria bacterium]|nr:response regulator [Deltaproteobacteria bacterium]